VLEPYRYEVEQIGRRSVKNLCLSYLSALEDPEIIELCVRQYRAADNLTDVIAALLGVNDIDCPARAELIADFYERWKSDPVMLGKAVILKAIADVPHVLADVKAVLADAAFDRSNPNLLLYLIRSFCAGTNRAFAKQASGHVYFHAPDGSGYAFLADQVIAANARNPIVAAKLAACFGSWRRYAPSRQAQMQPQLERILSTPGLGDEAYEVVKKMLGD
jgi:aminopeptidase N